MNKVVPHNLVIDGYKERDKLELSVHFQAITRINDSFPLTIGYRVNHCKKLVFLHCDFIAFLSIFLIKSIRIDVSSIAPLCDPLIEE